MHINLYQQANLLDDSKVTLTMSWPSLSHQTTVKSCPVLETRPCVCGTPWLNANTLWLLTTTGFRACDSCQTAKRNPFSFPPAGTNASRPGTCLVSCHWANTLDTLVMLTASLFLQMDLCALPAARTLKLCCGTWMKTNTCTLWTIRISSTPWASHQASTFYFVLFCFFNFWI